MELKLTDCTKSIGGNRIWTNVNATFHQGKLYALTGDSGSGKSTLLNCIGLIDRCEGRIEYAGQNLNALGEGKRRVFRAEKLGYLFQDYALVDYDSVQANIELTMVNRGKRQERHQKIQSALEQVGLAGRQQDPVFQLSGGQRQRVALARLLVRDPAIVLADEPTGALDRENAAKVLQILRNAAANGACVIVATHDPWVVEQADEEFSISPYAASAAPARYLGISR